MNEILIQLESILSVGYTILSELESDNPDIERIEALYVERSAKLATIKAKWNKLESEAGEFTNMDTFKNMFLRLNLLEKNLNRNLATLKTKKADTLHHINALRNAKSGYDSGSTFSTNSLFVDFKSSC